MDNSDGQVLKRHLRTEGVSIDGLCRKMGISRQTLYNWFEKSKFDDIIIEKLRKNGELNTAIFNENVALEPSVPYGKQNNVRLIPYYDLDGTAGQIEIFTGDHPEYITDYFSLPQFSDCDGFMNVYGDSMYPKYKNGEIKALKTGTEVVLPIKPSVYEILKRNNFAFETITNQESNRRIKDVCMEVGLKAADKVTTHTARRSGATNLYIRSVKNGSPPIKLIMDLGGWKKEASFKLYIRVNKIESAIMAADLDFYK